MNIDNYIKDLFDVFENKNASDSEKKHAIYFFAHQIADMQKEACERHSGNPKDFSKKESKSL